MSDPLAGQREAINEGPHIDYGSGSIYTPTDRSETPAEKLEGMRQGIKQFQAERLADRSEDG